MHTCQPITLLTDDVIMYSVGHISTCTDVLHMVRVELHEQTCVLQINYIK